MACPGSKSFAPARACDGGRNSGVAGLVLARTFAHSAKSSEVTRMCVLFTASEVIRARAYMLHNSGTLAGVLNLSISLCFRPAKAAHSAMIVSMMPLLLWVGP